MKCQASILTQIHIIFNIHTYRKCFRVLRMQPLYHLEHEGDVPQLERKRLRQVSISNLLRVKREYWNFELVSLAIFSRE